jgi:phosphoribosylglycinamide formyltransferase-1
LPNEALEAQSSSRPVTRLGFLISGSASHVLAVAEAITLGRLSGCEIAIVVCNIPGAPGAEETRAAGLTTVTMEGRGREQRDHEDAIDALLRRMRVDVICMAGYLRILSAAFLRRWPARVLSVHPSLLPAFPRVNAAAAAFEFGARVTGCTVFFVDDSIDGGVILDQRAVSILDSDTEATLSERVLLEEHEAYIDSLARILAGTHTVQGRRYIAST